MKENLGPLSGIVWFGLVLFLAVAMFIFAALFVALKSLAKGLKIKKFDLSSFTLPRFAR